MLPAMMLRMMMLFEERDADTISLYRTAPRRFFRPSAAPGRASIAFAAGSTRYGAVDANLTALPEAAAPECTQTVRAGVAMRLHGRGYVGKAGLAVELRLRAHGGGCGKKSVMAKAVLEAGGSNLGPHTVEFDKDTETVTVKLPSLPNGGSGSYHFSVVATFANVA